MYDVFNFFKKENQSACSEGGTSKEKSEEINCK